MKKKRILIFVLIATILLIISVIVIVTLNNNNIYKIPDNIEMPEDTDLTDNNKLLGNWNSKKSEIYVDNELKLSFIDVYDKTINFYSDNLVGICYIKEDTYNCIDSKYAFVDNKLYIPADTYLSKISEVIFDNEDLIIKFSNSKKDYSLLYFTRE